MDIQRQRQSLPIDEQLAALATFGGTDVGTPFFADANMASAIAVRQSNRPWVIAYEAAGTFTRSARRFSAMNEESTPSNGDELAQHYESLRKEAEQIRRRLDEIKQSLAEIERQLPDGYEYDDKS